MDQEIANVMNEYNFKPSHKALVLRTGETNLFRSTSDVFFWAYGAGSVQMAIDDAKRKCIAAVGGGDPSVCKVTMVDSEQVLNLRTYRSWAN
jgi:hypothetical protein